MTFNPYSEPSPADPDTVVSNGWYPTPAQYEAYKKREVELVLFNKKKGLLTTTSLFSDDTLRRAGLHR